MDTHQNNNKIQAKRLDQVHQIYEFKTFYSYSQLRLDPHRDLDSSQLICGNQLVYPMEKI